MKRRELVFEGDRWVTAVAAVGDGFAVGIGGGRPRVVLLDGALTPLDELTVPAEVRSLAASPSAKALAIGTTTGRYTLVEFAGRTSSSSFEIPSLSWVEDARGALWRSEDALVAIRGELIAERLADGRLREFERKGATELLHLSLCADGSRAATGDSSKALRVWDVAKGKQLRKLNARQFARSAFSPDGAVLAWTGAFGGGLHEVLGAWAPAGAFSSQSLFTSAPVWRDERSFVFGGGGVLSQVDRAGSCSPLDQVPGAELAHLACGPAGIVATDSKHPRLLFWPVGKQRRSAAAP